MKRKNVGNAARSKMSRRNVLFISAIVLLIVALGVVGTFVYKFNTSDATIAEGNKAFASQQYDAALEKYATAQDSAPIFAEPFYNAANVLYKQNKFEDAQKFLEQALTRSNEKIAELIQFNLGNVAYNAQEFEQAIARYEEALRLNPDDVDAKHNLELALLQKQQQDQQQQNQQQQNQQQQNQQQQNQQQQNQDSQQQDSQNQQDNQQSQDQQNSQPQDSQNHQDAQNQQDGQSQQPQQQQQGQQNAQQQNSQNQQNGQSQPDQNAQQQNSQNPQQANGTQAQPTDEQGNEQGYTYVPGEMTQEQAEQLLAAVGGNSQTLMEKLQQYLYVPGGEPDKDW